MPCCFHMEPTEKNVSCQIARYKCRALTQVTESLLVVVPFHCEGHPARVLVHEAEEFFTFGKQHGLQSSFIFEFQWSFTWNSPVANRQEKSFRQTDRTYGVICKMSDHFDAT